MKPSATRKWQCNKAFSSGQLFLSTGLKFYLRESWVKRPLWDTKRKLEMQKWYTSLCWHHRCHTVKTSALWGKMLLSSRSLNSNEATKLPPIHIKICLMKFQTNHPSSNLTCTAHYNHADYFWAEKSLLFCLGFLHSCGPVSQQGHSIFALMQSPTALKGEKHSSYYLKVPLF